MTFSFILAQEVTDAQSALQIAWKYFQDGGHFMYPLLLCLIAGFTIIVFKLLSLRRGLIIPAELVERVDRFEESEKAGIVEPLLAEFERGKSALARLAAVAVRNRGTSQSEISDAVQTAARYEILQLGKGMTQLDVVIVVSPLLGLLGTASGLAFLFQEMAQSGDISDAQRIALGIAIALNTTIFGLAITIPCVIAQSFFNRKIESITTELELVLTKLAHACQKPRNPIH